MLKWIFWGLLGLNGLLFALGHGYLGTWGGGEREPARLLLQQNADKLTLVSPAAALAASKRAAPAAVLVACTEIGNFVAADAARFEASLAPLALGERQARRNLPGPEISSYMVFIPPQGSKEGADRKAGELKQLGVSNYFIMSDSSALPWAISLGVFKSEAAAQKLLAALARQGVHSARIAPRMAGSKQMAFQLRDLDAPVRARVEQIMAAFPDQEMRDCK